MRALRLVSTDDLRLATIPVPEIGPDDVLVRVAGAGLCHTDVAVASGPPRPGGELTLGHETAGWIEAMGPSVTGFSTGQPVLVCLVWSCGHCRSCRDGRDNTCVTRTGAAGTPPCPGLGPDGGMAEYIRVPAQHLEPLGTLDPVTAGPLADAGLTPMHAINSTRHRLDASGATALVIGVGGLGHLAVQLLRATSAARVLAVDIDRSKLDLAQRCGAHEAVLSDERAPSRIRDLTDGYGVDVVLDFVGTQATLDLATRTIAPDGALRIVGAGGGAVTYPSLPEPGGIAWGVDVRRSYTGTRADQRQVIELAARGDLVIETVPYALDDALQAFQDLRTGTLTGRAILVP